MFTLEQIKTAHAKIKSGADFPIYAQEIKQLGVIRYETFVENGRTLYHGIGDFTVPAGPRYDALAVAETADPEHFKTQLKAHQEGRTDFGTFCKNAAESGVEKWTVSTETMTCTYYDQAGSEILIEEIPQ